MKNRLTDLMLVACILAIPAWAIPSPSFGKVEVLRDHWGIPHVFSETDAGAMYGLGYATAEERGFQMTYNLRIIQGRLAEIVGNRRRGNRNETAVDHDRKMRTLGWAKAAERTASNLDRGTRKLLAAYCEGINDSFQAQELAGRLHPGFRQFDVAVEPWTPADCLLSWWHLAQFFATDGTRDLIVARNRANPRPGQPSPPQPGSHWFDDGTAVVQPGDVSARWLKSVERFGLAQNRSRNGGAEAPKFSHAWVVGGERTTTGAAVLVSDPQTPVRNPSIWQEFHVSGQTFNARGVGVPGSPGLLIGFNRQIAWGLTALGADQADLFRLETHLERTNEYRWNGKWRRMNVRTELIRVKGASAVELVVRETHLGPVVSAFAFRQTGDPEVALKRMPLCEPERDTIQAVFGMMRAENREQFVRAMRDWRFPSANCVYGDAKGHCGYSVLGAIPIRSRHAPDPNGSEAGPGTRDEDDWQGFVPQALLPQVADPRTGVVFSANHRPVGSFYKIPLGLSTGSMGDTIRSWRLRELLSQAGQFTPAAVLKVHHDTVNPARREIVRLGLHLRDTMPGGLSPETLAALSVLEEWFNAGSSADLRTEGAELATRISTFFRFTATPLAFRYGGGESGLARFLKTAAQRIKADPIAPFDDEEFEFIEMVLGNAWSATVTPDKGSNLTQKLGWFDTLDGFGSLDATEDLVPPALFCVDGQTIQSQASQSYTQWVPLHDVDSAQTICPIGHSDRSESPYRKSTMTLWAGAELHPAPLNRKAVSRIVAEHTVLSK